MCACLCVRACALTGSDERERASVGEETRSRKHVSGTLARRGSSAGVTRLSAACKQHEFILKEGDGGGSKGEEDSQGRMTDTDDGNRDR